MMLTISSCGIIVVTKAHVGAKKNQITVNCRLYIGQDYGQVKVTTTDTEHEQCPEGMHELEEDKCHTKNGCGEGCQRGECPQEGVWKNALRAGSVEWGPKLCRIWGPGRAFRVDDVKFNPCRCTAD